MNRKNRNLRQYMCVSWGPGVVRMQKDPSAFTGNAADSATTQGAINTQSICPRRTAMRCFFD